VCRVRRRGNGKGAVWLEKFALLSTTRYLPFVGRVLIAVIFVLSGIDKVSAPTATQFYIAATGLPLPIVGYVLSVVLELGGGLLLVVGWQTRIVAAVIAAYCLVTAAMFHHAFADENQLINFLKNVAMAGGLLQVVAFGSGSFSLDSWRTTPAERVRPPESSSIIGPQ
jgi:putative oxidoreductase